MTNTTEYRDLVTDLEALGYETDAIQNATDLVEAEGLTTVGPDGVERLFDLDAVYAVMAKLDDWAREGSL